MHNYCCCHARMINCANVLRNTNLDPRPKKAFFRVETSQKGMPKQIMGNARYSLCPEKI